MENSTEVKKIKFIEVVNNYSIPFLNCDKNPNYSIEAVEKARKDKHAIPMKYLNLRNNLTFNEIQDAKSGISLPNKNGNGFFLNNPNHKLIQCYYKYCGNIYIIDDDEDEDIMNIRQNIPILQKLPFTLSCGKKRPHYFFICDNMPSCLREKCTGLVKIFQKFENLDILKFLVEDPNGDFTYYSEPLIPKIDFEKDIKPYLKQHLFKDKIKKEDKIEESYIVSDTSEYFETCEIDIKNIPGYDSNQEWFKMRILLKSAFGENGRSLFHDWSIQSKKYSQHDCDKEFERNDYLKDPKHALNILKSLTNTSCNYFNYTERQFAELFYENNKNKYVVSNKHLYELNKYFVWCDWGEKDFSNRKLKIHDCIEPYVKKYSDCLLSNIKLDKLFYNNISDVSEKQEYLKLLNIKETSIKKESEKCIKHIGSMGFLLSISRAVTELFTDNLFYKKFDQNINLFAFDNVLFDCSICQIREIKYDDYISKTCGYNYSNEYSQEIKNEIIQFIKDIVNIDERILKNEEEEITNINPNDIHSFVIDLFSSCLKGDNSNNIMTIFTGRGGNGKSILCNLFKSALNNYYGVLPGLYYQKDKTDANNHDSIIHSVKDARVVMTSEINSDIKIKQGAIESITGNEAITSRGLYEQNITWIPKFKPFILINDITMDFKEAIMRRIVVVRFLYLFRNENDFDANNPYHKKADLSLSSKFGRTEYRDAFINILIENYKLKFSNGVNIKVPEYCKKQAIELKSAGSYVDGISEFLETNFIFNPDCKAIIPIKILYECFKDHAQINDIDTTRINLSTFSKKVHLLGKYEKKTTKYFNCLINIEHKDKPIQEEINKKITELKKKS